MSITNLRIGSYVYGHLKGYVNDGITADFRLEVHSLDNSGIVTTLGFGFHYNEIHVIPLDEVLLEEFKFEFDPFSGNWKRDECYVNLERADIRGKDQNNQFIVAKINYLHELQNIFSDMRGKKLTSKF